MMTTDVATRSEAYENGYQLGYSDALNDVFEAVEDLPLSNADVEAVISGIKTIRDTFIRNQED